MKNSLYTYAAFFFALLGFAFSLLNIFDTNSYFCLTSSCEVFSEFTFLNISLWIYSAAFFFLLFGLLCIKAYLPVIVLSALGLLGDILLLGIMLVTAPCFSCLVIALILALLVVCSYKVRFTNNFVFLLVAIWGLLFIINAGALVKSATSPYAIYMNEARSENPLEASMRVYFSPSCSACNDLVALLGDKESTNANDILWLPVSESSEDVAKIAQVQEYINKGFSLKDALEKMKAEPKASSFLDFFNHMPLQVKLLINQSRLSSANTNRIPFIEYTGVPAFLNQKNTHNNVDSSAPLSPLDALGDLSKQMQEKNSPNKAENTIVDEMLNFGVEAYCDESRTDEEPCE